MQKTAPIAAKLACSGVLMLNMNKKVLCVNKQGHTLCKKLSPKKWSAEKRGFFPPAIEELFLIMKEQLTSLHHQTKCDLLHKRLLIKDTRNPIILNAFGIKDSGSFVLILLDELCEQTDTIAEQAKEIFQLTPRETEVVRCLVKEWSNKQIAHSLGISEASVKANIKRLMYKTRSESRVGVVLRILLPSFVAP